ncbi:MAG TPA: type II toxin-antitoxin system VapC family toxin [Gammaproteobacteria bacterium]|nr:type II toxin-antitoxin system VapC family toxin [Gammaproteobacteria bacterium]
MIVLDASAAVELLLNTAAGSRIAVRLAGAGDLHSPHLIDIEITQTLRRLLARTEISRERATLAFDHWSELDIERYNHRPFLNRIWALKDNFSAYDAAYVALAEVLQATLVTGDQRLANAPGSRARIEWIG